MAPTCVSNVCQKTPKTVSGPLVPFDEEMTMVFSGPMDLYQLARTSQGPGAISASPMGPLRHGGPRVRGQQGLVFMRRLRPEYVHSRRHQEQRDPGPVRRPSRSGNRSECHELHALHKHYDGNDCGFSRGLALHGFKGDAGGSKIFATKFRMPVGNVTPAIGILPRRSCGRPSTAATAVGREARRMRRARCG